MPKLSNQFLSQQPVSVEASRLPSSLLALPEKVLQFGTGVLLRGLPDYFIDKANRQNLFNGRIVVVKSTEGGDLGAFSRQDGLYTLCIRGIEQGRWVEKDVICSAISRVLSAKSQWDEILDFAASPGLEVVISNTTEAGIQLVNEDIRLAPPQSFPGKLLAVLYRRFQTFGSDPARGLVVVPTELIADNGRKLESIVLELAHRNNLSSAFIDWLESDNYFCNSLVDRIVPGRPEPTTYQQLQARLGYHDELLTMAEAYCLWAIEGGAHVRSVLTFEGADPSLVIRPDITLFRELKLRLLNGTHTLSFALAHLAGFVTVRDALADDLTAAFVRNLLLTDLLPAIPYPADKQAATCFAMQVLDRFRNPYLEHRWLAISTQATLKMQQRVVPSLLHYYEQCGAVPRHIALGVAAYLVFMRGVAQPDGKFIGQAHGRLYQIQDERAAYFADAWARLSPAELTTTVLHNTILWNHDLTRLPHFSACVGQYVEQLLSEGAAATLEDFSSADKALAD